MTTVTRDEWMDAGLRTLAAHGEDGLRIDRLCADLGVTKGSFHHHFAGIADYRAALLARHENTVMSMLAELRAQADGVEPRAAIAALAEASRSGYDLALERSIRAWALHDPVANAVEERLDRTRLDVLTDLWQQAVPDRRAARAAALVPFLVSIGLELTTTADEHDRQAVFELLAALVPHVDA
ncbi:MAG: TetR/AcrR family transcriptional regulator [Microbacterium sp.]